MNTGSASNGIYLDIETTGLSPANSHVTVIGTAFLDGERPILRQFVCEKPTDEKKLLREFADYLKGCYRVIHFNGNTFDIPYLKKKFSFYRLDDPFFDMSFTDLYQTGKRIAPLLQMSSLKQKDFEKAFSYPRTDRLSGSECVSAYRSYLRTGEEAFLDKILLHNKEDVFGMIHIAKHLEGFLCLMNGEIGITDVCREENDPASFGPSDSENEASSVLSVSFVLPVSFPQPFFFSSISTAGQRKKDSSASDAFCPNQKNLPFEISIMQNQGVFRLPGMYRELKYFFENYKDYYYLPLEGRAIHKSVGRFVEAAYREKATKNTAYEPVAAVFFPEPSPVIRPACKENPDDLLSWFRSEDIRSADELKELIPLFF